MISLWGADALPALELPRLYLSDLWLFNRRVELGPDSPLKAPLSETVEVVLSHQQNDVSISFVGIQLDHPEGTRYDYRLVNFRQILKRFLQFRAELAALGIDAGIARFESRREATSPRTLPESGSRL